MNKELQGIIFSLVAFSLFAITDVTIKFILNIKMLSYLSMFMFLSIFSVVILSAFILIFNHGKFGVNNKKWVLVKSVLNVINTLSSMFALSYLSLDKFYPIVFFQPIISTIIGGFIFKYKITINDMVLILIGFLGVLLISQFWISNKIVILGILLALSTSISGSFSSIVIKQHLQKENPINLAFYSMCASLAFSFLWFTFSTNFIAPNSEQYFLIFLASLFPALGIIFFVKSYQSGSIKYVAPMQYVQLVWGLLFGFIVFKDYPNLITIVGASIIIFSCFMIVKKSQNAK